jgi:hypothetical protein
VERIPDDASQILFGDLGIRPSDLFNRDICLMVEGKDDVIFWEHCLTVPYADEFRGVSVAVLQYGGSAAAPIISGDLDVTNIVPAQKCTFWIRDRDAAPSANPDTNATQFKNALEKAGGLCHMTTRREIEYYYPEALLIEAQDNNAEKQKAASVLLNGDQARKFKVAASENELAVPTGRTLKKLLAKHVTTKADVPQEFREIIEGKLVIWRREILGEEEPAQVQIAENVLAVTEEGETPGAEPTND